MRVEMPKRDCTKWSAIKVGQCFIIDNELHIKIDEINGFNSVCLNSGQIDCFCDDDYLEVVSAHAVVEQKKED